MPHEALNTIDDYEAYLSSTLAAWSPQQRLALAAAMTERWLPAYDAFSAAEEWGDPESLRRGLEAVWGHLGGRALRPADRARYRHQLKDSTPHMDDFEAYEALAACVMLDDALECCGTNENTRHALDAALSGFEAAVPEWSLDPDSQPRLWQQIAARKELKAQLSLLEQIGAATRLDEAALQALRRQAQAAALAGQATPHTSSGPAPLTNQAAFEQYRRQVEASLKRQGHVSVVPDGDGFLFGMQLAAEWMARYLRRAEALSGKHAPLADVPAQQALLARQRARDAADPQPADWSPALRQVIVLVLRNNHGLGLIDAGAPEEPHAYGPSLRRLWLEAQRQGRSEREAAQLVLAWAHHRPAAWDVEDRRKQKGLAYATPELGRHLARAVAWQASGDPDQPWAASVDGQRWSVRLNDFPDDTMYSLLIAGAEAGSFHDWPETWQRG